ncbi:MAG: hydrogenase maturation protease [Magnetococcales bacterium]|nr:hydrogenase maturation protease [Magnetococcales bacterium]
MLSSTELVGCVNPGLTVAGLGSRAAGDDAIGLALVEALARTLPGSMRDYRPITTLLWEDADALTLAHDLTTLPGPLLIVDCADMGLEAGAWRAFSLRGGQLRDHLSPLSTHGLGLAEALAIAVGLGYPHTIDIFGVQPFALTPYSGLTTEMSARFPVLLEALQNWLIRSEQAAPGTGPGSPAAKGTGLL